MSDWYSLDDAALEELIEMSDWYSLDNGRCATCTE